MSAAKPATSGAIAARLPDGRLHLQHGPIDLIIAAEGAGAEQARAFEQAQDRFDTILQELVSDLPALRDAAPRVVHSETAAAMQQAVARFRPAFVTPMAAVAGAVAQTVLAAMIANRDLRRAYVNNGGDIALYLREGQDFRIAIHALGDAGRITVNGRDPVRGIATSGWRGRSLSLGIADAVTVLANSAAEADVAATMIANRVDCPDHPGIIRKKAVEIDANSDLGARFVTTGVPDLSKPDREAALYRGAAYAQTLRDQGLIAEATLFLQGSVCTVTTQSTKVPIHA